MKAFVGSPTRISTSVKLEKSEETDYTDDDGNDGQTYDIVQQLISQNNISNNSTKTATDNFNKLFKQNLAKERSIREKFSLRLWALACLQRSGAIEVLGFHPPILFNDGTELVRLEDELSKPSGYSGVMEQLSRQGRNKFLTPTDLNGQAQKRMLVVKIKVNTNKV